METIKESLKTTLSVDCHLWVYIESSNLNRATRIFDPHDPDLSIIHGGMKHIPDYENKKPFLRGGLDYDEIT